MKLIATLFGVILIAVAVVYFTMPADSLPGFFPGHETGVTRMHYKHGLASAVAGISLAATTGGGLYWLVLALLAAYVGALANAWVLLIEILR